MLGFLSSWLSVNSSATTVSGVLLSKTYLLCLFCHDLYVWSLLSLCSMKTWLYFWHCMLLSFCTCVSNKSSSLTKGIVSPLQTLLVCYWSVSELCWQNLFITNSSTFAQNVIHALITLSLDYCRSFFYSHPKSFLSKFQDSWLVSYSREQSYQLALPSFSWPTFYCSTQVKIALWISEGFMVLLQLIISAWSSSHFTVPPLYSPSLSHVFLSELYCWMFGSFLFISQICVKKRSIL